MIEEVWVLWETKCIFHRVWTSNPLSIDAHLFSGFISALFILAEEAIDASGSLKNIEFLSTRFTIIKRQLNEYKTNFVVVGRSAINTPVERSFQELQVLVTELSFLFESNVEFAFLAKPQAVVDIIRLQHELDYQLDSKLDQWIFNSRELLLIDKITLINLMSKLLALLEKYFDFQMANQNLFVDEVNPNLKLIGICILKADNENIESDIRQLECDFIQTMNFVKHAILRITNNVLTKKLFVDSDYSAAKLQFLNFLTEEWFLHKYFQIEEIIFEEVAPLFSFP